MKTIGIVGTRSRDSFGIDFPPVREAFKRIYADGDQLVSGGCPKGADRFAELIAKVEEVPIMIHYAQWNKHGRSAGFVRNGDIARDADVLIACISPDRTGGTEDTIKKFIGAFTEEYMMDAGKLILV